MRPASLVGHVVCGYIRVDGGERGSVLGRRDWFAVADRAAHDRTAAYFRDGDPLACLGVSWRGGTNRDFGLLRWYLPEQTAASFPALADREVVKRVATSRVRRNIHWQDRARFLDARFPAV